MFCQRAAPAWWAARLSDAGARGATRRAAARSSPFRTGRTRRRATSAAHLRGLQFGEAHLDRLGLVREGLRRGVADLLAEAARVLARSAGFEPGCDGGSSRLVGDGFCSASASASAGGGGAPPPPPAPTPLTRGAEPGELLARGGGLSGRAGGLCGVRADPSDELDAPPPLCCMLCGSSRGGLAVRLGGGFDGDEAGRVGLPAFGGVLKGSDDMAPQRGGAPGGCSAQQPWGVRSRALSGRVGSARAGIV